MSVCPHCGRELSAPDRECPSCKKPVKKSFTILSFLWDNFRLFTMIGITGTMISLIPNMGNRILGTLWISDAESLLPLFLSIIIFFGTLFLTICFFLIFSLILAGRTSEPVRKRVSIGSKTLFSWYEGDLQRFILLTCLVPMWFGLLMFFIMIMPLIPNQYSWVFSVIVVLTLIPLALYSFFGWKIGKALSSRIPALRRVSLMSTAVFCVLVIAALVLAPYAIPLLNNPQEQFSGHVTIKADQKYFSPHVSSSKGLRLELTNLSGSELLASRQTWCADYGYFIRVIPSTGEVFILGNPAYGENSRDIYWTYSGTDPDRNKTPVRIDVILYPRKGDMVIAGSSLSLDWFTNDIVSVNTTASAGHPVCPEV
jgi:hypothetical protein